MDVTKAAYELRSSVEAMRELRTRLNALSAKYNTMKERVYDQIENPDHTGTTEH